MESDSELNTGNQIDSTLCMPKDISFGNKLKYYSILSFYDVKLIIFFFAALQKNLSV
jgi:hypothetical protein